jgi:5-methyltetrahydropteroyltriglutamate--homocysteine methyltransferase
VALSTNLGYPRVGKQRELKRVIERYWRGEASEDDVHDTARKIRAASFEAQLAAGIDLIPTNDFSFYDQVLDTTSLWGLVPERFSHEHGQPVSLSTYFAMARGDDETAALELTKWFDTNYHYLVPEFDAGTPYRASNAVVDQFTADFAVLGSRAKPVILGPITFKLLGKRHTKSVRQHVEELLPLYAELLHDLKRAGASWVQIDEPCLVQDRTSEELELFKSAYGTLSTAERPQLMLQTYFGSLGSNWDTVVNLPVEGIGIDFVRTTRNLTDLAERRFPQDKTLSAGVVNGRGVWRTDLVATLDKLDQIQQSVDQERLWVGPSSSLIYLPHDIRLETQADPAIVENLAFAEQRLDEISLLTRAVNQGRSAIQEEIETDQQRLQRFSRSNYQHPETQQRIANLTEGDFHRDVPVRERLARQAEKLGLPSYPTTTIGSFPQAPDVRSMRAKLRTGRISEAEYEAYVHDKIDEAIQRQEQVGLDVLVHGEFERTDMVEYFAEQMAGFLHTEHGWVQSYGTRCVRPPVIVGDVYRPKPMTVETIRYAQSRTSKPVKGMLTGPVTILNWSFSREDVPRSEIAYQIALALRDEVADLEAAGIAIIQIDEPALREGLPLRRDEWQAYIDWAISAFRLSASGIQPTTQIHTHMCYSEFNEIIEAIGAMDADVISIENSRSNEELLRAFTTYRYQGQIGPGVYDVHSARVPNADEMAERLANAATVLNEDLIWVNPDCGLKTRRDPEVWPSLANMVDAARKLRSRVPTPA